MANVDDSCQLRYFTNLHIFFAGYVSCERENLLSADPRGSGVGQPRGEQQTVKFAPFQCWKHQTSCKYRGNKRQIHRDNDENTHPGPSAVRAPTRQLENIRKLHKFYHSDFPSLEIVDECLQFQKGGKAAGGGGKICSEKGSALEESCSRCGDPSSCLSRRPPKHGQVYDL